MKKKLPPFGKQLKDRMRKGYKPRNGVNIYTSWIMGKKFPHAVTFPPETDPKEYNWSFLAGLDISLINTESYADYEKLKQLAVLLVQSGARRVGLIDAEHSIHWFIPEAKREVAA